MILLKSNMSNFFENGKMHYRELSRQTQYADNQKIKSQHQSVCLNLYNYEANSQYSQQSVKINTRENSASSISFDSKTPFSSKFALKTNNNQFDSNNQLNSDRMSLQNSERIDKAAVPTTNWCAIFQNYRNYKSKNSKRLDLDKQEYNLDDNQRNYNCNTKLDSYPYVNLNTNRTVDSQNKCKFKRSIDLCVDKDSQNSEIINCIDEKQGAINNFELPETIQSARKLLQLVKDVIYTSPREYHVEE